MQHGDPTTEDRDQADGSDLPTQDQSDCDNLSDEIRRRKIWLREARSAAGGNWTQSAIAERLDLTPAYISALESEANRKAIPKIQLLIRVSEITKVPLPQELLLCEDLPRGMQAPPAQVQAKTVADEIREIGKVLAGSRLKPDLAGRNAELFARRYGVFGADQATLKAGGDKWGLTRERVRQIVDRLIERIPLVKPSSPQIDLLAAEIRLLPTLSLSDAEFRLRERLGEKLGLLDAQRFSAEVLGKSLPFVTILARDAHGGEYPVFSPGEFPGYVSAAINVVKKLTRHLGGVQLVLAWAITLQTYGRWVSLDEFRGVVEGLPGFAWLDTQRSWFWLGHQSAANRIADRAVEILSVAGQHLDIETIYAGIARHARTGESEIVESGGVFPPIAVVASMLRQHPTFHCKQYDDFGLVDYVEPATVLSVSALALVEFLQARDGMATRKALQEHFVKANRMNPITLGVVLASHPVVRHVDRGIFALRGWPIDPHRFQECWLEVGVGSARTNAGAGSPDDDGFVSWEFVVTASGLRNRAVHLPSVIRRYVADGSYQVVGKENVAINVIESRVNGVLSRATLSEEIDVGDRIRVRLHLGQRIAFVVRVKE